MTAVSISNNTEASLMTAQHQSQFIKLNDLVSEYHLAKSTVYYLIKTQGFPKQIKLSARSAVWRRAAVDQWFADKEAQSIKVNS